MMKFQKDFNWILLSLHCRYAFLHPRALCFMPFFLNQTIHLFADVFVPFIPVKCLEMKYTTCAYIWFYVCLI